MLNAWLTCREMPPFYVSRQIRSVGQTEVLNTGLRKLETRVNELVTVEVERREVMQTFLDKQALAQVERDRVWKDWQTRFETIEKQATDTEKQLVALEATHREAKRVQLVLEELNQRVERRINEITEIQRLAEDQFRQEWVTFKADDQKRWTSYTLTQEEQRSESRVESSTIWQIGSPSWVTVCKRRVTCFSKPTS